MTVVKTAHTGRGLPSRFTLFTALTEIKEDIPGIKLPKDAEKFCNEVYGRKACIYIDFDSVEIRLKVENELEERGFKVNRRYCAPDRRLYIKKHWPVTEVQVAWFKGHHWDE